MNSPTRTLAIGAILAMALVACRGSQPGASLAPPTAATSYLAQPGEPLTPVKVGWCAISAGFAQLYVARDAGLFPKYGLDVKASLVNGSDVSLAALQSGEIDFVFCAAAATIPGLASGVDAMLIGAPLTGLPYVMVARKGIQSVQDLRGKSIGISKPGDLDDRLSRAVVKEVGLPANSVTFRPAGGQTDRYRALLSGIVDAVNVTPPLEVQAKKDGLNVIYQLDKLPIPFIYSALHTNSKMIRERPQVVQRFVAAMAEAVFYMEMHKAEAERSISKQLKIEDQESLGSAYQAYAKDIVNRSMEVPLPAVQDSIDYARQQGSRILRGKAQDMVDNQFALDLRKSGFLERLWGRPIPPPSAPAVSPSR
jgi:NitT/TauT family transport system substrate-binding protein